MRRPCSISQPSCVVSQLRWIGDRIVRRVLLVAVGRASAFGLAALVTAAIFLPGVAVAVPPPLSQLPQGVISRNNVLLPPRGTPHGWVILIHGGGWMLTGFVWDDQAAWFNARGWGAYAIDYRAGVDSLPDTLAAYDWLRQRHPRAPICADGSSSGGWLALMLAALRKQLACLITEAGPTDLQSWESEESTLELREWVHLMMAYTFAPRLWMYSPVRLASRIRAERLMATGSADIWVPPTQMEEMKRTRPSTITMTLQSAPTTPGGLPNFTHTNVTPNALARFRSAEATLLNRASREVYSPKTVN
jgi:acetyl esterase/lipase